MTASENDVLHFSKLASDSAEENRELCKQVEFLKNSLSSDSESWEKKFVELETSIKSLEDQNKDLRRRSSEADIDSKMRKYFSFKAIVKLWKGLVRNCWRKWSV